MLWHGTEWEESYHRKPVLLYWNPVESHNNASSVKIDLGHHVLKTVLTRNFYSSLMNKGQKKKKNTHAHIHTHSNARGNEAVM
jgi:hypothetical protein